MARSVRRLDILTQLGPQGEGQELRESPKSLGSLSWPQLLSWPLRPQGSLPQILHGFFRFVSSGNFSSPSICGTSESCLVRALIVQKHIQKCIHGYSLHHSLQLCSQTLPLMILLQGEDDVDSQYLTAEASGQEGSKFLERLQRMWFVLGHKGHESKAPIPSHRQPTLLRLVCTVSRCSCTLFPLLAGLDNAVWCGEFFFSK